MYSTYLSDERRRDRENPPRPFGFHPNTQSSRARGPRVADKIGPYFVVALDLGTTKAFGLRLVWPDFLPQRCPPYKC